MTEDLTELQAKLIQYEQRQEELELRVEELTDFIENAALPLHWVNSEGKIIWANQAELDYLGYSKEEYIGYSITDFHADTNIINDILIRLTNNETLQDYPATLKSKDGELKHVLINSNVLRKEGKFIHTRCFTRDVTEIKKEEQRKADLITELEDSEARLRMAIQSTNLGTWDYAPISGELNWSAECKKIYGLPPGIEIDINFFSDHIYPNDKDKALGAIAEAMDPSGEGNYDVSYRIIRFDSKEVRWIRAQGKVHFNADKQAERFIGTVIDTTDTTLFYEKITRSEKLFKSIASNIPKSLIIVIDKDYRFLYVEGDNIEKLGFDIKNYEGKHAAEILQPGNYATSKPLFERVIAGEKFAVERISKSGEEYLIDFVPLKDDNGTVYAGLIISHDITDIKQAEEKSAKLAAIVESSDDAIISKTTEGIITSWNKAAERIFGYTDKEMLGESILKIIPPERSDEEPQIISRLKKGERVEHFETQRITKNRELLDLSLTISPLKDSQGRIIGVSKIARDITEKKKAEKLIRSSEEHLQLAIKAAELGTFDMDLIQGTMEWDRRCRELFGIYTNDTVSYNNDFLNGLHVDDRDRVNKVVEKVLDKSQSNGSYDVEYRTVGIQDGKLRWVRAMGQAYFDEQDRPIRFLGAVLDITDKKQEELRKNDFIAIVSHELKTPLTSIKSYVQVLLAKERKEGDSFRINALTRTESQANKMAFMIQDFLNLARLEEGKVALIKEWFDIKPLLEEIVGDVEILTSAHTFSIKDCDLKVHADKDKISRVLMNLVSNAIKYSPKGGAITIGCELEGDKAKIYVGDEGIGISEPDQKRLFDRFYRVENEKIKTVSGFGIGLYLVSEILRYHDSKIEVESKEGLGSTFCFYLDSIQ